MILHVAELEKFIPSFIAFVEENFDVTSHRFWLKGDREKYPFSSNVGTHHVGRGVVGTVRGYWRLLRESIKADKIILHGLFDVRIILFFCCAPWLLKKCYWVIWGGDLYVHEAENRGPRWWLKERIKSWLLPRIRGLITHIRGDYELAQRWYGAKGQWHECFMYTSNLCPEMPEERGSHDGLSILLGNSATPTNRHFDALSRLSSFASDNIKIYCPLSYGDEAYALAVEEKGRHIFGEKFFSMRSFFDRNKYILFLSEIDIAIFNNDRQQGMGTIVSLLGLGCAVYLRPGTTMWRFFLDKEVVVHDVADIRLQALSPCDSAKNRKIISEYFSKNTLINQLQSIGL